MFDDAKVGNNSYYAKNIPAPLYEVVGYVYEMKTEPCCTPSKPFRTFCHPLSLPLRKNCIHLRQENDLSVMKKHLIISTSLDLVRIAPECIVYIASDGNYSTLVQRDGEVRMVSYQLGQIEKMISDQLGTDGNIFIRIGKSLIINRSFIYYINIPKQKLILSDTCSVNHTVTASKEALKQLKELIEQEGKL